MRLELVDYDQSLNSILGEKSSMKELPEVLVPTLGKLVGVYSRLDATSTNKRFYSSEFWRGVLNRKDIKESLRRGRMVGTFEHPSGGKEFMNYYNVNGEPNYKHPINGSHVTKRLWIEGKNLMGESYILNTKQGRSLATYLLAKDDNGDPLVELNISARGGSRRDYIGSDGLDHMRSDDYRLDAFDVVLDPGIKGARVKMESDGSSTYSIHNPYIDKVESAIENYEILIEDKRSMIVDLVHELKLESATARLLI